MSKVFKAFGKPLMLSLIAIMFNCVMGAIISVAIFNGSPILGAVVANAVVLIVGSFAPSSSLCEGVLKEVWTGEMIKAFRTAPEQLGWYDKIRGYDQYVDNDVIHFVDLGGDPEVLINNTTYPLLVKSLEDADKGISLDKYETEATGVTDDELYAVSYDKMGSVIERHQLALKEKIREKAIHAIAPSAKTDKTPVLLTTGALSDDGTHKLFTFQDIINLKRQFDKVQAPQGDRVLVLCSDHVNDLLLTERRFKEQYNVQEIDGLIMRLYGFTIYEYNKTPYYNAETLGEKPWGALANPDTDRQASVAYINGRMMKANGSVKFYYREASLDPEYHRNVLNYMIHNICLPLKEDNSTAAIVSALPA